MNSSLAEESRTPGAEPLADPLSSMSSFRNLYACDRCRKRKNFCDKKAPKCTACVAAAVECVYYRSPKKLQASPSHVVLLENRVRQLENVLKSYGMVCPPADDLTVLDHSQYNPERSSLASTAAQPSPKVSDSGQPKRKPLSGLLSSSKSTDHYWNHTSQSLESRPLQRNLEADVRLSPVFYLTVRIDKQLCIPEALAKTQATYRWLTVNYCEVENISQSTADWLIQESFRLRGLDKHCLPWTFRGDPNALDLNIVVDTTVVPANFDSYVLKGMEKECIHILDHYFYRIAQGTLEWMCELKTMGYTTQDLVLLHFDQRFDRPWIRPGNTQSPACFPEPEHDFHRPGCPHSRLTSSDQQNAEHRLKSAPQDMPHLLSRICGLAGLKDFTVPRGYLQGDGYPTSQGGFVCFSTEGTRAQVRYPESLSYMLERIEDVCGAIGYLQTAGLLCDSWTIIVDDNFSLGTASGSNSPPMVELHTIMVEVVLALRNALRLMDFDAVATAIRETFTQMIVFSDHRSEASQILARIFNDEEGSRCFTGLGFGVSENYLTELVALATQVLSLSLVSFICAHVGSLKLEFLLEELDMVNLTGCGRYHHITMYLQRLTCLNDMTLDPSCANSHHVISWPRLKILWTPLGGNILFTEHNQDDSCIAISVGGGLIAPTPGSTSEFHWNAGQHLQHSSRSFERTEVMTIGSLSVNTKCTCDMRASRKQICTHLHVLGTCRSSWEFSEKEIGFQAGQYFNLTGTVTFNRIPGIPLKKVLIDNLWCALERPFGLQISVCTALARRVPLRIALADNLHFSVESNRPYPSRWNELSHVHNMTKALRTIDFKSWYDNLPDEELRTSVVEILRKQTIALGETGVQSHSGIKSLVAAWWSAEDSNASIHLSLSHKANAWARMLEDTPETATFAYVTDECLESWHHKCLQESVLIKTGITSMLLTELHECTGASLTLDLREPRRQISATHRFLPDTTYDIGPEDGCLIAKVRKASQPNEPDIEISQINVPARIWRRARFRRPMTRLVERGAYVESDQGQEVHISSETYTGRVTRNSCYSHNPRSMSSAHAPASAGSPSLTLDRAHDSIFQRSVSPSTVPFTARLPHTDLNPSSSIASARQYSAA